ncbi:MAG: hypothetical protein ACHQU0_03440 [Candidatus Paceibacteria bacterium]
MKIQVGKSYRDDCGRKCVVLAKVDPWGALDDGTEEAYPFMGYVIQDGQKARFNAQDGVYAVQWNADGKCYNMMDASIVAKDTKKVEVWANVWISERGVPRLSGIRYSSKAAADESMRKHAPDGMWYGSRHAATVLVKTTEVEAD